MEYTLKIEEVIKRPIIRNDKPEEFLNKMIDEEKILCAAIWYKELPTQNFLCKNITQGIVVCGLRHGNCIDIVKNLSGLRTVKISPDGVGENIQGFLTNKNRFVDRTEGALIHLKNGGKLNYSTKELYSEDLY